MYMYRVQMHPHTFNINLFAIQGWVCTVDNQLIMHWGFVLFIYNRCVIVVGVKLILDRLIIDEMFVGFGVDNVYKKLN